ncbi:MAG: aspartate/glutamate racemase family protein [Burkholderiaceae bacterium]
MRGAGSGFLGVLMLDTRFPRPVGDIGNTQTFARLDIPVRYSTVHGASPQRIVQLGDPSLLQPFIDAGRVLVEQGARLISTSCGFLALWQAELAQALPVPVLSSSLLQCADWRQPGIVTIDAAALGPATLLAAGVPDGTPIQGVAAGCEFQRRILGNDTRLDLLLARQDVVAAALQLVAAHPQVDAIVLECTNMPPYRQAVIDATGRPVLDIISLLAQAWADLPDRA